jgi:hypothetical protein
MKISDNSIRARRALVASSVLLASLLVYGCSGTQARGTAQGAAVGASAGAVSGFLWGVILDDDPVGRAASGAAVGAGAGAAGGYVSATISQSR